MKKILIIMAFWAVTASSMAQDTMDMDHLPKDYYHYYMPRVSDVYHRRHIGFYYNYSGFYYRATPNVGMLCPSPSSGADDWSWEADPSRVQVDRELAALIYNDTVLRVKGAALVVYMPVVEYLMTLGVTQMTVSVLDTAFNPIASTQVLLSDTLGNRHFQVKNDLLSYWSLNGSVSGRETVYGIYNLMFDSVVSLAGDFYLSAYGMLPEQGNSIAVPFLYLKEWHTDCDRIYTLPHLEIKLRGGIYCTFFPPYTQGNVNYESMADDVWHTLDNMNQCNGVPFFFPILDMQCEAPQASEVDLQPVGTRNMRLTWRSTGDSCWQVSYGPAGTLPGEGAVRLIGDTTVILTGLEPGVPYVAYLRTQCNMHDGLSWSDWSDSIEFVLANVGIDDEAGGEMYEISVTPNPASGRAMVALPAGGGRLTIIDAAGRVRAVHETSETSFEMDISALAAGVYVLRLETPRGSTACRFTVR